MTLPRLPKTAQDCDRFTEKPRLQRRRILQRQCIFRWQMD